MTHADRCLAFVRSSPDGDTPTHIVLQLDFSTVEQARAFLTFLTRRVANCAPDPRGGSDWVDQIPQ
ncbi:MAG TPA: hypothetical protein VMZ28_17130 [Kofleriaceae bacterium]|nr:hypothetical protein [Kofleriaceae bacterium]